MNVRHRVTPLLRHRKVDTPLGTLVLVASSRGLVRIAFEGDEQVDELVRSGVIGVSRSGDDECDEGSFLDSAEEQLEEYFRGERESFALVLNLSPTLPGPQGAPNPFVSPNAKFHSKVQIALLSIRFGETASYADVARLLGSVGAARAVGTACATNPLPIVLPCHRVVRADGKLGGYTGGIDKKRKLLEHESVQLSDPA